MDFPRSFLYVTFASLIVDQSLSTVLSRVDNKIRIATPLEELDPFTETPRRKDAPLPLEL